MAVMSANPMKSKGSDAGLILATLLRRGVSLLILVSLALFFSTQTDRFLQERNLTNILQQNAATLIVAVGMTLTMLVGGIDLSVGSVAALAGAISAGLITRNGASFELAVLLTLAMGFGIGVVNGLLVVRGKLPPFVATLATLGVGRGLTLLYTEGRPISGLGDAYTFWGRSNIELFQQNERFLISFPAPLLVAVVVLIVAAFLLSRTRYGLHVYAIGGSEETARLAGVPVDRVKLLTYGLSGLLAALAGMLLTARLFSAQPRLAEGLELDAIAAAVLGGVSLFGGVGNVWGAAIGALLVGTLANGMNLLRIESYQQQMIQGVVLVGAVLIDRISQQIERK